MTTRWTTGGGAVAGSRILKIEFEAALKIELELELRIELGG
jgi:hypothetical protein